jgi:sarcosine oxidase, subunit beta
VVVGAGIMGASIAYSLARSGGGSVVILERSTISGGGASARSHANTPQYYTVEPMAEMTARSWRSYKALDQGEGDDDDDGPPVYHKVGMMYAYPERLAEKWERQVASQKRYGLSPAILGSAEIKSVAPQFFQEKLYGACYEEEGGFVDSRKAVRGYIDAARRSGASLFEHTALTGLEREKDGITLVSTERGSIRTTAVICASGAWTRPLLNTVEVDLPITNSWAGICILKRPDCFRGEHMTLIDYANFTSIHAQDALFTDIGTFDPRMEAYSQGGLSVDPDDHRDSIPDSEIGGFLEKGSLYPGLEGATIRGSYGCVSDDTPDYQPMIGEIPGVEGVYVAAGFSGHGFKVAPAVGEVMCAIASHKRPPVDVAILSPSRFREHRSIEFDPLFDVA